MKFFLKPQQKGGQGHLCTSSPHEPDSMTVAFLVNHTPEKETTSKQKCHPGNTEGNTWRACRAAAAEFFVKKENKRRYGARRILEQDSPVCSPA